MKKSIFKYFAFCFIGCLLLNACSNINSDQNEKTKDASANYEKGSTTIKMFVPDYYAMAEKSNSESRAIAPQTAFVEISGWNSNTSNWDSFQRVSFDKATKTPVENSPEGFPGSIFEVTFDKVYAKSYAKGELKISLLNSSSAVITSGTNQSAVTVQNGQTATTTFYTLPSNTSNSNSNLLNGEMKFVRFNFTANTHYTLHVDVESQVYPDVVIFGENGTFENYIAVDSADSSRIEFTESQNSVKYIGVWADDGAISNYNLALYRDFEDFTFKDSSIGFWSGESYKINLTPIPSDSYLGKATYSSSNENITVSEDGLITGTQAAEGEITVSYNGISHSIAVNVYEGATELTGVLTGEKLQWTKANSPYKVTGNILVKEGSELTVEPGVKVYFAGNYYLKMNGTIKAVGTKEDPIIITKSAGYSGNWDSINIAGGTLSTTNTYTYSDGNILQYVNLSYATNPLVLNTAAYVDHCNFADSSYVKINSASVLINNNLEGGIYCDNNGAATITNNKIFKLFRIYNANPKLSNNTIENASIYLRNLYSSVITNNTFLNSYFDVDCDNLYDLYSGFSFTNNNLINFTGEILNITNTYENSKVYNFTGNYWGESQTQELIANEATGEKNVSFIHDNYDDFTLTEIDYSAWQREPIESTGYKGDGFIAFDYTVNGYDWNSSGHYPESQNPELTLGINLQYNANSISEIRVAQGLENLENAEWQIYSESLSFTADLENLQDGYAALYVQIKDTDGNISSPVLHNIPFDSPVIECSIKDGTEFVNPTVHEYSFTATDNCNITNYSISVDGVKVDSSSWNMGPQYSPGTLKLGLPYMSNGEHILQIDVTDSAGNLTSKQISFTLNKSNSDVSSLEDVSWSTITGQPLKDEKTVYLWHLDSDGSEVSGDNYLNFYSNVTTGFNGSTSNVYTRGTIPLDMSTNAFTVEYWIKGDGSYSTPSLNLDKSSSFDTNTFDYIYFVNTDNSLGSVQFTSGASKNDGKWHYVSKVYSGKYGATYIDGVLVNYQDGLNYVMNNSDSCLYMNLNSASAVDEIRISNAARSPDEIAAYYKEAKLHQIE